MLLVILLEFFSTMFFNILVNWNTLSRSTYDISLIINWNLTILYNVIQCCKRTSWRNRRKNNINLETNTDYIWQCIILRVNKLNVIRFLIIILVTFRIIFINLVLVNHSYWMNKLNINILCFLHNNHYSVSRNITCFVNISSNNIVNTLFKSL